MSIEAIFKELFDKNYRGNNNFRDYSIMLDYYFPTNQNTSAMTLQELADKYGISDRERIRQIKNDFKKSITNYKSFTEVDPVFQSLYSSINNLIKENESYLSIEELSKTFFGSRSCWRFTELGNLLNASCEIEQIVEIDQHGYIVPRTIKKSQLIYGLQQTKKLANHFGSVYPFEKLLNIQEWNFIPSTQRLRFIKELLQSDRQYFELGNGEFLGFLDFKRDRLLTRLLQIFAVYEKVPIENLVNSLHRTLKKRLLNDKSNDLSTLEECSDVYDEYCLKSGYCSESDGLFTGTEKLNQLIQESTFSEDKMLNIEKELVQRLRENGAPMDTQEFIPLMEKIGANKSHNMEFAMLFYRTGFRRNSIYHTLDDLYLPNKNQVYPIADRARVEINKIFRDSYLTRKVKRLCNYYCQICGERLQISDDKYYSEIHHIRPLGNSHNGPDVQENMLCVCPNCHVLLDYGVIQIDHNHLHSTENNPIKTEFIDYHNQKIYKISKC